MRSPGMLSTGQAAPQFSCKTASGEALELQSFIGKKIWLAFFRHANCPFCHLRMHEMRENYDALGPKKLQIIAVFQSPPEHFAATAVRDFAWYPLVSDPEERLYSLYGLDAGISGFLSPRNVPALAKAASKGLLSKGFLKIDGTPSRYPADFFINPDGLIHTAYYGENISDNVPFVDAMRFAKAQATTSSAVAGQGT